MGNNAVMKKLQVDDAVRILGNIPHVINPNNTIAIPSLVGTIMLYPTTGRIQLGREVRNLVFPYLQSHITDFINEMVYTRS
jgi:hypothetical protein